MYYGMIKKRKTLYTVTTFFIIVCFLIYVMYPCSTGRFSPEVTVVTAYFTMDSFSKGEEVLMRTAKLYEKWMQVFGRLDNPVIFFTDSRRTLKVFQEARRNFPSNRTQLFLVDSKTLWSFSLTDKIKDIFNQPNYPKYFPNTVMERYSCTMHAKYELINKVISEGLLNTAYISWMDIGLFRDIINETYVFHLDLPVDFRSSMIAFNALTEFGWCLKPFDVVRENLVWVGGGLFVGRTDKMLTFTEDYKRTVLKMIEMNLMSTDQQVLYIMYLPNFNIKPRVKLQLYNLYDEDDWFYLGYLMQKLGYKKINS